MRFLKNINIKESSQSRRGIVYFLEKSNVFFGQMSLYDLLIRVTLLKRRKEWILIGCSKPKRWL
jgi:hypothetical protein